MFFSFYSVYSYLFLHCTSWQKKYYKQKNGKPKIESMEDIKVTSPCLITSSYKEHYNSVCSYINYRINNWETAKDLSQDVFLRLIDYRQMLRPDTVKFFIFTIARNLLTDYLRRYYKKQEITSYLYDHAVTYTNETESHVIAKELSLLERHK